MEGCGFSEMNHQGRIDRNGHFICDAREFQACP
jgi:hypothetical protein